MRLDNIRPLARKLLTIEEASLYLGTSTDEMQELMDTSLMPYCLFKDNILLLEEDVQEYKDFVHAQAYPSTIPQDTIPLIRQSVPQETLDALQAAARLPEIGYVYILRYQGHYKIGKAMNVKKRATTLGVQMPEKYELIHTIEAKNPLRSERILQKYFAHKCIRGEWFALNDADIQWIKALKRVTSDLLRDDALSGA